MKREILRVNNLSYAYTQTRKLEEISLYILEGECVGFLGLTYSGKDLFIHLLEGSIEADIGDLAIYIDGERMADQEAMGRKIYRIGAGNYAIDDWTVAEYIGLVDARWPNFFRDRRWLEDEVAACFEELDLVFDVSEKIGKLSELDKRIMDLVKAYRRGARVVIIEDELDGINHQELVRFGRVIRRIAPGRMAVIVSSHSNMVVSALSDKYIIFNKGRIVKKCRREYIQDASQLEAFLLEKSVEHIQDSRRREGTYCEQGDRIFSVRSLRLGGGRIQDLDFFRGQVTAILARDLRDKEYIFDTLAGRQSGPDTYFILDSHRYVTGEFRGFVEERIVSIKNLGGRGEVFDHMTVGENLLLPSLRKMSSAEYICMSGRMEQVLATALHAEGMEQKIELAELEINEIIRITLERWYIYKPRVLVMFEPFAQCDMNGTAIVREYIQKFARRGTAVIIVNTREENIEDIADRVLHID